MGGGKSYHLSMVTTQKLERQGMQKFKELGVGDERTLVWGALMVVVEMLDQNQDTKLFGDGYGDGFGLEDVDLTMATMDMMEGLEVATLKVALIMEEKEENMVVGVWL